VFFWLGIALGHGLEVYVPQECNLFKEPLYGYEGGAYLGRKQLIERKDVLERNKAKADAELEGANATQAVVLDQAMADSGGKPGMADAETVQRYFNSLKAQEQALHDVGCFVGALAENERYLEKCAEQDKAVGAHMLARQEFELNAAQAAKMEADKQAQVRVFGAEARIAWKNMDEAVKAGTDQETLDTLAEKYHGAHQTYLAAVFDLGRLTGMVKENVTLLDMVDTLIQAAGGYKAEDAIMAESIRRRSNGNGHKKASRGKRGKKVVDAAVVG
jgi:hypothetical protein